MPNEYYPGQGVVVEAQFIPDGGVLTNPTTVTLVYKKSDTSAPVTVAQGSLTNPSTGIWRYTIDTTTFPVGDVHWGFYGTGAAFGHNQGVFRVLRSQLA